MSMPQSIKKLTDFINTNGGKLVRTEILAGNREECVALDLGMMLVQRCAAEVFRAHKLGLSWDGDLDPEDIVVINEDEVRITKILMPGNGSKKVRDVRKVGDLFMPKFVKGEKTALYFTILENDLATASADDVEEEWFPEFILGHPGLKPSMVRYDLIGGVEQTCSNFNVQGSKIHCFLSAKPSFCSDWRDEIPEDPADVFHKIFNFRHEEGDGVPLPFKETNGGLLTFLRNFT